MKRIAERTARWLWHDGTIAFRNRLQHDLAKRLVKAKRNPVQGLKRIVGLLPGNQRRRVTVGWAGRTGRQAQHRQRHNEARYPDRIFA